MYRRKMANAEKYMPLKFVGFNISKTKYHVNPREYSQTTGENDIILGAARINTEYSSSYISHVHLLSD